MKNSLLLILFGILMHPCFAQRNHHVFLEAGGCALYGSLNYEYSILHKNKLTVASRIGIGVLNLNDFTNRFNPDIVIPLGADVFFGTIHHVELNLINTFTSTVYANQQGEVTRNFNLNGSLFVGYRYQKPEGRWVARAGYTPIFENYQTLKHWAGISIGYRFE